MLYHQIINHPSSEEWIVFLHGAGGSSGVWYKQIRAYSKQFNLMLIDLRGHGQSALMAKSASEYNFRNIAGEVIEVLDTNGLKNCHFIGLSLGTVIIREILEIDPSYVKSMILAGAVIKFSFRSRFLSKLADMVKGHIPYMWLYRIYARIIMPRHKHRESRKLFIKDAMKLKRDEFMNWMTLNAQIRKLFNRFWAKEFPIPTLYIMGEHDHMFLSQVKILLQEHTHNSQLAVIAGAGHICNVDDSNTFNSISLDFLNGQNKDTDLS